MSTGYTCPWCRQASDGSSGSCPFCGAPVDVRAVVTESGWFELPAIKDMARLQFGRSHCQVEGTYVPVADVNLGEGDWVYFTHHLLLWRDASVTMNTMPMAGAWKRMFAGLPLIMLTAQGPGHIAFSRDEPGEMVALPIQPGQAVDVREHTFLVATGQVSYDYFPTNVFYTTGSGDETETYYPMGMFMDRFHAVQQPGLLLLHAAGNAFVRTLQQGQTMLIKPNALLFKDPTVGMQLHFERPRGSYGGWGYWSNKYAWLRVWGPGRVAVESASRHLEDPGYQGMNLFGGQRLGGFGRGQSPATEFQW